MNKLNSSTRKLWAEKTMEMTNIGAGALIFGQFISAIEFSLILMIMGIALIIFGYIASLVLLKKK